MWLQQKDGLTASLFGPCVVNTTINGKKISIREETAYPDSQSIRFIVDGGGADFTLKIRKPRWAKSVTVSEKADQTDDFIILRKKWTGKQTITVGFEAGLKTEQDLNGEYFFSYGPLVLAHPIASTETQTKTFSLPGFADLAYRPEGLVIYRHEPGVPTARAGESLRFNINLVNSKTGRPEPVLLEPVARTILRQVTFKAQ
jgi:DUF1680 family protein